jgi:hypothetical protein
MMPLLITEKITGNQNTMVIYDLRPLGSINPTNLKLLNGSFFSLPLLYMALDAEARRREVVYNSTIMFIFFNKKRLKSTKKMIPFHFQSVFITLSILKCPVAEFYRQLF